MIINRFEDAVAQKSRMAFYLEKGYKIQIVRDPIYCFCPATSEGVVFKGSLNPESVSKLTINVVR